MTLDAMQILLIALAVTFVEKWAFIVLYLRGQRAPTFPPVPVGPVDTPPSAPIVLPPVIEPQPDKPPASSTPDHPPVIVPPVVIIPPAAVAPRFHGQATCFGDNATDRNASAYGGMVDGDKIGFAIPARVKDPSRLIRAFFGGKTVQGPIFDVGPHFTTDDYWDTNTAPRGKSLSGHNKAIIDLTPAAWAVVGRTGPPNQIEENIAWDFVDVLDKVAPGPVVAPPVPVSPIGPAQPAPVGGGTVLQKNKWPTPAECPAFYGNDEATIRASLVSVQIPWLMNGKTHTIPIHKKCAESLTRIVNFIWETCGKSQDQIHKFGYDVFDGSFVPRNIAGSSERSYHWYGAAIDWDAARNPQHATAANTEFKEESLITTAFKREGCTWGGNWSPKFRDGMHFEFGDQ